MSGSLDRDGVYVHAAPAMSYASSEARRRDRRQSSTSASFSRDTAAVCQ